MSGTHGTALCPNNKPDFKVAGAQSMRAYAEWGRETEMKVQDSAGLARPDEPLSFLQLQARASSVDQVLLGWYRIPKSVDQAVQLVRGPFRPHAATDRPCLLCQVLLGLDSKIILIAMSVDGGSGWRARAHALRCAASRAAGPGAGIAAPCSVLCRRLGWCAARTMEGASGARMPGIAPTLIRFDKAGVRAQVVNPEGASARCVPRVWNRGDGRLKLISLCNKARPAAPGGAAAGAADELPLLVAAGAARAAAAGGAPDAASANGAESGAGTAFGSMEEGAAAAPGALEPGLSSALGAPAAAIAEAALSAAPAAAAPADALSGAARSADMAAADAAAAPSASGNGAAASNGAAADAGAPAAEGAASSCADARAAVGRRGFGGTGSEGAGTSANGAGRPQDSGGPAGRSGDQCDGARPAPAAAERAGSSGNGSSASGPAGLAPAGERRDGAELNNPAQPGPGPEADAAPGGRRGLDVEALPQSDAAWEDGPRDGAASDDSGDESWAGSVGVRGWRAGRPKRPDPG